MACFGIHLGNSSVCLVLNKDGKSEVVANDLGDRVTPAVLALNESEWEIGASAKTGQTRNKPTISNNKRLLNSDLTEAEMESFISSSDCKLVNYDNSLNYELPSGERVVSLTPDDIAAKLFGKMFSIASHAARCEGELQATLAAPLHWSEESRQRVMRSAELAGFTVLQVISEPAAALLAHAALSTCARVLVYRLGGTSCDVTVLTIKGGACSVDSSAHLPNTGGRGLTELLAEYIADEFYHKWKLNPRENRRAMSKLFHHADNCKHVLSTLSSSHVFIESLYEGVDWSQNITRARFDNLIAPVIPTYISPLQAVLEEEKVKGKIDKIILCGGSMKIPKLQSAVSSLFPDAELLTGITPDEVIAQGCSKQAALLLGLPELNLKSVNVEVECISAPIFAKYNNLDVCLFPAGTPIFSEIILPIDGDTSNNDNIDISVYETDDSQILGNYSFPLCSKKSIHATLENKNLTIQVV